MSRPLELLIASAQRSEHCALVTLVGIHGAAPRRIGAQMAVSATGEVAGSFSGGCLDAAVIEEAQRAFADSVSRRVRCGADSPYVDIVLPCGSGHADLSCALSSGTDGSRMTTVIAIIAAGDSTRLGQPKQLVQWRGRSLLQRAIDTACEVAPRVLVTLGAHGDALWGTLHLPPTLERINVADHRDGLSASLRAAVSHLDPDTAVERLLVMLVDQYAIDAVWLRHLLKLAGAHPQRIVASRYAGVRGVPAVFPRSALTALAALQGDAGARAMLRDECDPIDHIAPHPPCDVDTPAQISPS